MGNCESMQNRTKKISKILSFKDSNRNSKYSSSSSPNLSSTHMPKDDSLLINAKKYNSVRKLNIYENNQYILPMELAKREDITKKYIISKTVLGDGATSLVYLAENSSKQKFAIKRINKEKKTVNQKVLLKEAEICLKLNHKNIIKYYEIYEDIKYINIVMEQGQTDLFEFLIKSPLGYFPDEIAVDFLIQIFSAIDYLHSINIVHCDIKPENFVLKINKTKTELKLVDFGNIRRKPKDKERLNNFSGTREYMAPEALENYGFNEKVDEWAAGVIMYNMLTGADPFSSDNDSDYKDNIRFKEIKFEYIKNEKLRNLNKKLLNRFINNRITAKEAIDELINIKNEMIFNKDNNLDVFKNLNKFDIIDNKTAIKNYS
jgi:serine/threonine protein kinase